MKCCSAWYLAGIAQSPMHRLHGLPLAVIEQPIEIAARGIPLRLAAEARAELIEVLPQALQQRPRGPRRHGGSVHVSMGITRYKGDKVVLIDPDPQSSG